MHMDIAKACVIEHAYYDESESCIAAHACFRLQTETIYESRR